MFWLLHAWLLLQPSTPSLRCACTEALSTTQQVRTTHTFLVLACALCLSGSSRVPTAALVVSATAPHQLGKDSCIQVAGYDFFLAFFTLGFFSLLPLPIQPPISAIQEALSFWALYLLPYNYRIPNLGKLARKKCIYSGIFGNLANLQ
jgi:hypothetical protein